MQDRRVHFQYNQCTFNTVFGKFECHRIYTSGKVPEKIEILIRYSAVSAAMKCVAAV